MRLSRARITLVCSLACTLQAACTDGPGPTDGAGRQVLLDLAPSFQVDPALYPSDPIERIRLDATDASTRLTVGSSDQSVSPTADEWVLSLDIDLGGASTRDVYVEVELLSESAVEWSGRLGPITVRGGTSPQGRTIDIHRGPLDNLDVLSLAIQSAPAQLGIGSSVELTAALTLVSGSNADATVYWASSDPAVATITPQGTTATLTGVAAGSVDVFAAAGAATDEFTLVVGPFAPSGFDLEWRGTTTSWSTASNWSTGQLPQPGDNVYIPASSTNPTITSNVQVTDLTIASGASVTLTAATLTVSGDLDAQGPVSGTGSVSMTGAGTSVRGTIQTPLMVSASIAANGTLSVQALDITGASAGFDVNGQSVTLLGTLLTNNGGVLRMTSAAGQVTGVDAYFLGGSTSGLLTAGQLRLSGDFEADTHPLSFAATGTHTVIFQGSGTKEINFSNPGVAQQRFQNVTFNQPGLASIVSDVVVSGTLNVASGSVVADDYTVSVGGAFLAPNGGFAFAAIRLIGNVTALPATLTSLEVAAAVTWPNNVTVNGNVVVSSALNVGTTTLTVTGEFFSQNSLVVPLSGTLSVGGTLYLDAGTTFTVDGTVTAAGCENGGAVISGSGTHPCGAPPVGTKVWVGGAAGGGSNWHIAANWSPPGVPGPADDVTLPADVGVTLSANASIADLDIEDFSSISLDGFTLTVSGDIDADGTLTQILGGLVDVTGAGALLAGSFNDLRIAADRMLDGQTVVTGDLTVAEADLDLNGQVLTVINDVTVSGDNAHLVMTDPADILSVQGNVLFDGGSHANLLTEGYVSIGGHFTVSGRSSTGFVSSGNQQVVFIGATTQTITFAAPGASQQRLGQLFIATSPGGATFVTNAFATNLSVTGRMSVAANATVMIDDQLTLLPAAYFDVDGVVIADGGCTNLSGNPITGGGTHPCPPPPQADRTWIGGDTGAPTDWSNADNWSPASEPSSDESVLIPVRTFQPLLTEDVAVADLTVMTGAVVDLGGFALEVDGDVAVDGLILGGLTDIVGSSPVLYGNFDNLEISQDRTASGQITLQGDLDLRAALTVGGNLIQVSEDLTVSSATGRLVMLNGSGFVSVFGNTTFDGASHSGSLAAGTLMVQGHLTAAATSSTSSFASTGTMVYIAGSFDQSVTFTHPASQTFGDVTVLKSGGAVVLGSSVVMLGDLLTNNQSFRRGTAGASLEVRGRLNASQVTFEGLPLRVVSAEAPNSHVLSNAAFTSMTTTDVQLYLELNGTGPLAPFTLTASVFATVPTGPGLYLRAVNTSPTGAQLPIRVTSPTPALPGGFISTSGVTTITWPYIP